jgi:uncharacterized protein (DUF433 family)
MEDTQATGSRKRQRVQLDLRPEQVRLLELLEERLGLRSRAELIEESLATLLWFVQERHRGRRVVSVDPDELGRLSHAVELATRTSTATADDLYDHLVAAPHPWRRQLSLKGRTMTVGQLVATMRADDLTPETAAEDLDLPLAQIREALAYYETHRDLVDSELQEDERRLRDKGYRVESSTLPR